VPGINAYSNKAVQRASEETGVDFRNLSAALKGRRGMSLETARKVAPLFGTKPVSLWVEAQSGVVKSKIEAGEFGKAHKVAGNIYDQLLELDKGELKTEGDMLRAAVEALAELIVEALRNSTSGTNPSATFGETSPKPKAKTAKKTRDAFGRRLPEVDDDGNERDVFGRRMRQTR
jgi:plasmid maintenance system antidote protein VapI